MSAVVEETQLQLQGNGCAANPALWEYLVREDNFVSRNK